LSTEQIWPARWGQERRLEFIDFRLLWEGRVNRSDLTNYFGISVPQASLDLAKYRELAPQNTAYDVTQKTYVATESFAPRFMQSSADAYLGGVLAIETGILEPSSTFFGWRPTAGVVHDPSREVDPATLRSVLFAIREHRTVLANYQSMTSPDPKRRRITPHAIAFDGSRWHARAYCHTHSEFRDFVLARISGVSLEEKSQIDGSEDAEWHREIDVVLAPHPELSVAQKRAIESDYGMTEGRLVLHTREALLFYLLRHLGLLPRPARGVFEDQVVLDNKKDLEGFFTKHQIIPS
jgi:predicted DNA-binding transcriptional regulator YafY